MCKILGIARSTYYAYKEKKYLDNKLQDLVVKIFHENQCAYGTRKIKVELSKQGYFVSRRCISEIMHLRGLSSVYTNPNYRQKESTINNENTLNIVNQKFSEKVKIK